MAISDTHDLGRAYLHVMRVPRSGPLVGLGASHEVEEPWRVGRCLVLRAGSRALVLGWWDRGRSFEAMVAAETAQEDEIAGATAIPVSTETVRDTFRHQPDVDATSWSVR